MKYSILVLGATISISFFIRLCCCLDQMDDIFSGRADEVYEKYVKFLLLNGRQEGESGIYLKHDTQIYEEWMASIKKLKQESPKHRSRTAAAPINLASKHGTNQNDEVCGNVDPPDLTIPECTEPDRCTWEAGIDLPTGCQYDETQNTMQCSDAELNILPPLPPYLKDLHLNETQIEKISENSFRNVAIDRIMMFRNQIDYIHPWAFHDVDNLKVLFITGNKITHLAYELYVGLENLTFMDLQYNEISFEIYQQCDKLPIDKIRTVLPQLSYFGLSGNPLTVIPPQMFAGLRDSPLSALYLDNCYLKEIDEEAFTYLGRLTTLELSHNPSQLVYPIEKFARVLKPLTSLIRLHLKDLGFDEFPLEALSPFYDQLTILDLSNNKFHTIKQEVVSKFTTLEELYLDESLIQIIEPDAFMKNTKLRTLTLRRNSIRQVPNFPPDLRYLFLSNIHLDLSSTATASFHNITSLWLLDVSAIKIDKITKTTLEGLGKLINLVLQGCGIQSIEDEAFRDLKSLKNMYLDDNDISELKPETFFGLDNLGSLSIKNNKIFFGSATPPSSSPPPSSSSPGQSLLPTPEENGPFKFLIKLNSLDLTGNHISQISDTLFENLPELCYIILSNNPVESWNTALFPDRIHSVYEDLPTNPNVSCFPRFFLENVNIQFMNDVMLQDFLRVSKIDFSKNYNMICDNGACKLRDVIEASLTTWKQDWLNSESYKCKDLHSGSLLRIADLKNETCARNAALENQPPPPPSFITSPSGAQTTIIAVTVSLSVVAAVVMILGYRNRAHLRYFWFTVKFNVMPVSPRKAKLSTMEDPSSLPSYDYDVFISYHSDDSKFIEDEFLPEIEQQDESSIGEEGVFEARNLVYLIENDAIIKNNNNSMGSTKPSTPRFKVCLHERDFEVGVPITENIVDCVDRSRKTVIFVSKKYMESQWCSYEMNLAYHRLVESRRKSFVLVLMEDVPTGSRSKVLNYLMVSKTYLQWPGAQGLEEEKANFWKRLRAFLQS